MNTASFACEELLKTTSDKTLRQSAEHVFANTRITPEEGLYLLENASLSFLGSLANFIREKKHQHKTYYNRNFHIEPTNICLFACKFCSYSRTYGHRDEGWELTLAQMLDTVKKYAHTAVTEVHIVGGVHPKMNLSFFVELLEQIKIIAPQLHIKGFTAVELDYMFKKAKVSTVEGLTILHRAGLDSLPGGGAEIFHPEIRSQICADKVDTDGWLHIHRTAHQIGMPSNATMLYGHIEKPFHIIDHMERLRRLQDDTKGFNTFIPLKFRNKDNEMSHIQEVNLLHDMKIYAMARVYLDNFAHLKAYWPMLGRANAQLSLSFGVNDLDGTIDDTTQIYSMAGSPELNPSLTTEALQTLITQAHRQPVERNTLYEEVNAQLSAH